jgi:hypothetical protein
MTQLSKQQKFIASVASSCSDRSLNGTKFTIIRKGLSKRVR